MEVIVLRISDWKLCVINIMNGRTIACYQIEIIGFIANRKCYSMNQKFFNTVKFFWEWVWYRRLNGYKKHVNSKTNRPIFKKNTGKLVKNRVYLRYQYQHSLPFCEIQKGHCLSYLLGHESYIKIEIRWKASLKEILRKK